MIATASTFTVGERVQLAHLEEVIERGIGTFVEVGRALAEVRDRRLYRERYARFEDYLTERWSLSHRHGYQLIESAEVAGLVCSMEHTAPANERQARELVPLKREPEQAAAAWQQAQETAAADGRRVTANDVRGAVRAVVSPGPETTEEASVHHTLAAPDAPAEPTPRQQQLARAQRDRLTQMCAALGGYRLSLPDLKIDLVRAAATRNDLDYFTSELDQSVRALRALRAALKEQS